ncbi:hypothetical protein BH23ACT10_BH23ACT10_10510 [soil metagenome]
MLAMTVAVTVAAVGTMTAIAAGVDGARFAVVLGLVVVGIAVPGAARRGGQRWRRRLRRQVGDPATVTGVRRQLLAAAWAARDQFAQLVDDHDTSPLLERLADHQPHVDAALARSGTLARDAEMLSQQLRGYRVGRLRRDLHSEQARDPHGRRARSLADQIAEADRLAAHVQMLHEQLETQVHDLRSAVWRTAALRTTAADDGSAVADLLVDLEHLHDAMVTVENLEQSATVVDTSRSDTADPASSVGRRYDV